MKGRGKDSGLKDCRLFFLLNLDSKAKKDAKKIFAKNFREISTRCRRHSSGELGSPGGLRRAPRHPPALALRSPHYNVLCRPQNFFIGISDGRPAKIIKFPAPFAGLCSGHFPC